MRTCFRVVLFVLALWTLVSCRGRRGACYHFDTSDMVGVWTADYETCFGERCWYGMTGVETLTLGGDGTYQQVYDDGRGYVYTSPWKTWRLEEDRGSCVLRLEAGRFYPLGIEWAEALAEGSWTYHADDDGRGQPLDLDGTEVILFVYADGDPPGGVYLSYPPVCVPDVPVYVDFHRVETAQ